MSLQTEPERIAGFGINVIYSRKMFVDVMMEVLRAANGNVPRATIEYELEVLRNRVASRQLY